MMGKKAWALLWLCFSLMPWALPAQDLAGVSICIDPGHGPGSVNAGPTGLREADINFRVATFLKNYLTAAGVDTVLLTHQNNATDISLSQREQIANNFGVDWFHSVHHNATGSTNTSTRYTLVLLEEQRDPARPCPNGSSSGTGRAEWPGQSDVMSNLMAERIFQAYRTSSFLTRLDWTFYGGCNGGFSLGVLNDLQMPGELSEGTFHDHPGEEAKMRNPDFLRMEARALAMSFFEYYNAGRMPTGALVGLVSDAENGARLNGITVTLQPGNRTYTTDNNRNGVYVFDDLPPGTYTVTIAAPEYLPLTATVTVAAHAFSAADGRLVPAALPQVSQVSPEPDGQNVYVYAPIRISFSRNMNTASVQAAFRLQPAVAGVLSTVANNPREFLFTPDFRFEFGTRYTVTIDSTASDQFGHDLEGGTFQWSFATMPLNAATPAVVDFAPANKQTQVFVRDVIEVRFNREMAMASLLPPALQVFAIPGNPAGMRVFLSRENDLYKYSLVPVGSLLGNRVYTVQLSDQVRDAQGKRLPQALEWKFKTAIAPEVLELRSTFSLTDNTLSDPRLHAGSNNFVADSTDFALVPLFVVSDSTAGRLRYAFVPNRSGAVFMSLITAQVLGDTDLASLLVFGDASGNTLRWHVRGNDGQLYVWEKRLDWTGWRNLKFEVQKDSVNLAGQSFAAAALAPLRWEDLSVSNTGAATGEIYFEDLSYGHPRSVKVDEPAAAGPATFALRQNYPNPFNPTTEIEFEMAKTAAVELAIFDPTGRRVRVLLEGVAAAGRHRVRWHGDEEGGRAVASGLYLVKMTSGNFTAVRKLLLVR